MRLYYHKAKVMKNYTHNFNPTIKILAIAVCIGIFLSGTFSFADNLRAVRGIETDADEQARIIKHISEMLRRHFLEEVYGYDLHTFYWRKTTVLIENLHTDGSIAADVYSAFLEWQRLGEDSLNGRAPYFEEIKKYAKQPADVFPPVVVELRKDGSYKLRHGFRRILAATVRGDKTVVAYVGEKLPTDRPVVVGDANEGGEEDREAGVDIVGSYTIRHIEFPETNLPNATILRDDSRPLSRPLRIRIAAIQIPWVIVKRDRERVERTQFLANMVRQLMNGLSQNEKPPDLILFPEEDFAPYINALEESKMLQANTDSLAIMQEVADSLGVCIGFGGESGRLDGHSQYLTPAYYIVFPDKPVCMIEKHLRDRSNAVFELNGVSIGCVICSDVESKLGLLLEKSPEFIILPCLARDDQIRKYKAILDAEGKDRVVINAGSGPSGYGTEGVEFYTLPEEESAILIVDIGLRDIAEKVVPQPRESERAL